MKLVNLRCGPQCKIGHLVGCVMVIAISVCQPVTADTAIRIIDGDTFDVGARTIRLHGIDAPEQGQRCAAHGGRSWECGAQATDKLRALLASGRVVCTARGTDRYDRTIASCTAGERDVAADLVSSGLAWAFRRYSDDYASQEAAARKKGGGIWQAATQPPWDWRAAKWNAKTRQHVPQSVPAGCPIKGNISPNTGERIYHMPWSRSYEKTRINTRKGERWFCDEAEARAAGWRAARS